MLKHFASPSLSLRPSYLTASLVCRCLPLGSAVAPTSFFPVHATSLPMCVSVARCDRRYYATGTRPCYQSWARNAMRPWMCPTESCRAVNPAVKTACQTCGTEKPKLQGWKCVKCGTRNHRGVKKCKECKADADSSKDFWMCAICGENNRVDELDDNSRCGYCGYDMAPLSLSEERLAQMNQQREADFQAQQERFDSITAHEAEEQFGDPLTGSENLPASVRLPMSERAAAPTRVVPSSRLQSLPEIKPFEAKPLETKHSHIYRRPTGAARGSASTGAATTGDTIPPGPPGFDWMCRVPDCGHVNPGDEEACMACGKHITPAEWECPQCAALNHLSRSRCFHCHAGIPVYWTCASCQATTSIYDSECRQCHAARPAAEPRDVRDIRAEEREMESTSGSGPSFRKNDWYCTSCNGLNFSRRTECYQCGTPRPATAGRHGGGGDGRASHEDGVDGDARPQRRMVGQNNWICSHCQASNFRTRQTCWQCSAEGPGALGRAGVAETDAQMPHFAKEGFQDGAESKPAEGRMNVWKKTDDWVCAKCFSKNFRGKSECYKCGAPRSLAVSPRRASVRKPVKL